MNSTRSDSEAIFRALGFEEWVEVTGRWSIADLFKAGKRIGIYVLRFANGDYYVGQAVDVSRRFAQHRVLHADIAFVSFQRMSKTALNDREREFIWAAEKANVALRNVVHTSLPKGESDFDLVMPAIEQAIWLDGAPINESAFSRTQNEILRRRYATKYRRFEELIESQSAIGALSAYAASTIPAVRRGEVSFWSVSCLPSGALARINVYWQEVLTLFSDGDSTWASFHLARTPLEAEFGPGLTMLYSCFPGVQEGEVLYRPGGHDQAHLLVPSHRVHDFLAHSAVLTALRQYNLRLMQKGPNIYGRYHCFDLADRLLE